MKLILSKKNIYTFATGIIVVFVLSLLSWAIFLGKENEEVRQTSKNTDYFLGNSGNSGFTSSGFGKVVEEIKDAVIGKAEELQNTTFKPVLTQLHSAPIAGSFAPTRSGSGIDYVYFTERSTGHVFKVSLDEKINTTRMLYTTIPNVQDSIFTDGGKGVIRRYLDEGGDIVSIYNIISSSKDYTEESPTGVYLTNNISSISVNQNGNTIFYIIDSADGAEGFLSSPRGEEPKKIWGSWVQGWNAMWTGKNNILLTQKPSNGLGGAAFLVDSTKTHEELVLSYVPGLITNINPSTSHLLYSRASGGNVSLFIKDLINHIDKEIPLSTFADKCVWSNIEPEIVYCFVPKVLPDGVYPDQWYQGVKHFSDKLWKINAQTGESELLLSSEEEYNTVIDAENPQISESEKYIFFTNRKDQTIWTIKLKEDEETNKETSE